MNTSTGLGIPNKVVSNYISSLVGRFYKILPIKESGVDSLALYIQSFQRELIGCKRLITEIDNDESFLVLLSILQYLSDNDCSLSIVKAEVFKAINVCKKLQRKYCVEVVSN